MNEQHELLRETLERLFADHLTREVMEAAEQGEWPAALWKELEENGLTQPLLDEDSSFDDARVIFEVAGGRAAPVPLAETALAGWLLRGAGLDAPDGPISLASGESLTLTEGGRLSGSAERVPWGRNAPHVVAEVRGEDGVRIALVESGAADCAAGTNLALEPRDTLRFDRATVLACAPIALLQEGESLRLYGALVRSAQIVGGLDYLLAESVRFVGDRVQFGRPLAKFQAIQHMLAVLASETAAAGAATQAAFLAADRGNAAFEIAAAKIRSGEAAGEAARIAHQVHGAIGFTYEHALHFATRRLWSWRAEFGAEAFWAETLGVAVAARGADALWSDLTAR